MGTKSKPPVEIDFTCGGTEVPPQDGLPLFKRYIDIQGQQQGQRTLTRLFLTIPSDEDIADTVRLKKSKQFELDVIAAKMPYFNSSVKTNSPLLQHCKALGFSDSFAIELVRLIINHLQHKHLANGSVSQRILALREFVEFLATQRQKPVTLADIDKGIWKEFLAVMQADKRTSAKFIFNYSRAPFVAYEPTSQTGWLASLPFRKSRRAKPSPEHSSELAETRDYSDVVMYQLLSLFVYEFDRRIAYLKRYERITEADMPKDWLYPGLRGRQGKGHSIDTGKLLREWLRDEERGYQVLIDHHLMHHKTGVIKENQSGRLIGGLKSALPSLRLNGDDETKELVSKFQAEMGRRHGYKHASGKLTFLSFYLKKKTPTEANGVINQIGWCLANLVMMQTGINKEVVLTIPSKAEDGRSILTRGDTIFVKKDSTETEINLYGTKARTGNSPLKVIPVIIVKGSPLYEMLIDYERYLKVGDGPFFEFDKPFTGAWCTAGQAGRNLWEIYPVIDESDQQLSSIDSTKFRKVFTSGQLLDRMKNIKDMNELAEMLRDDLNHGNLDTTLSNYIMKSTVGRSVIDIAIATITGQKLNELKCKSKIESSKTIPFKKKVFLCHCADPQNPSHEVAIADECRHYDLCLGCEQSIITKEHLPYVCLRILQYQAEQQKDPIIWPALFEDKWCIAHDALARYIEKDKKNGRQLVDQAWIAAHQGRVSLPPIIAPNRM
ncbi:hypothetical protein LPB67_12590 [Undibacterium sp. Jales W-56]|uniref:hypothetical protein n=1 Tax=Undibacterium sp. Jales W-56 TaxID=2897325 RepID=UPI0021CEE348|nr:hypothetical protein [Undibacterium sp. Jales W-56]MCU6434609.1 hypothetical protein [Undibacterium sp. Jales W-56]